MANKSKTKCLSCGEIFTADVRNRGRAEVLLKTALPGGRQSGAAAALAGAATEPELLSRAGTRGPGTGLACGSSGLLALASAP
jgi:hypothetical protein